MNHRLTQRGYILALVMIIISLLTVLITYMALRSQTFAPYASAQPDQMKARMLAYSGVQIAMAQLAQWSSPNEDTKKDDAADAKKKKDPLEEKKQLLKGLLPVLNAAQEFELTKKIDGIDATIEFCITAEDGKINLNGLWDFEKNSFVFDDPNQKDVKKIYEDIFARMGELTKTTNLLPALEQFFKARGYPLDDPTQLCSSKEFKPFAHRPFFEVDQKKEHKIFLNDIFTLWSGKHTIDPWVLSESLIELLDVKKNTIKVTNEFLDNLKPTMNWKKQWDQALQPIYEKSFNSLPKSIESILSTKFEPRFFSIISSGEVGKAKARVVAYLEIISNGSSKDKPIEIKIRKIYWL